MSSDPSLAAAPAVETASDTLEGRAFLDDFLTYLTSRAAAQIALGLHALVKAQGLSIPECRVLFTIADGPLTIGHLAEMMFMQQPTLTKLLDRMERAGTVRRRADPDDRRRVLVELTDDGRRLNDLLIPQAAAYEDGLLARYSETERRALKETLRTLIRRTA